MQSNKLYTCNNLVENICYFNIQSIYVTNKLGCLYVNRLFIKVHMKLNFAENVFLHERQILSVCFIDNSMIITALHKLNAEMFYLDLS